MNNFGTRLRDLIGREPVAAFARRVGLTEGALRKYLSGSEPSLRAANLIASRANCSLEWLATGAGYQYRSAELVDMGALEVARTLATEALPTQTHTLDNNQFLKLLIVTYQYLRSTKGEGEVLQIDDARKFSIFAASLCTEES